MVTHPSTNPARCRPPTLTKALALSHAAIVLHNSVNLDRLKLLQRAINLVLCEKSFSSADQLVDAETFLSSRNVLARFVSLRAFDYARVNLLTQSPLLALLPVITLRAHTTPQAFCIDY